MKATSLDEAALLDPTSQDEEPPDDFGPPIGELPGFLLLEELGRGGMGVVYKARQKSLQRLVALKMILAGPHAAPEERLRFRAEAEAAAKLQHPNIVQIHEVGEHQGLPYLALEYISGGSLAQQLTKQLRQPATAAELVETLARAMQAAHERGLVHRDLKPANVLLTADGVPKVSDFGLVKHLDQASGPTATGAVLGTPSYMAPEQASGESATVGPAVDVYALGAILYETLTGRPPFKGATPLETFEQVRTMEPVALKRLRPDVPRDLQTICLKCLAKEPRQRYRSAVELADDLHRFRQGEPIHARQVPGWERVIKWAQRRPAVAALVVVLALVGLLVVTGMAWHNRRLQEQVKRAEDGEANALRQQQRADGQYRQARAAMNRMMSILDDKRLAEVPRLKELYEGQVKQTLTFYQSILDEGGPLDPTVQKDVAIAFIQVGGIQVKLGFWQQAKENFQRAAGLLEDLAVRYPDEADYRAHLAICYSGLGWGPANTNPTNPNDEWIQKALALRERLCRDQPDNPDWQNQLAESYYNLGTHRQGRSNAGPPTEHYEKALAIRTNLRRRYPHEPLYAAKAGEDCLALGLCHEAAGHLDRANAVYRQGEELLQSLVNGYPEDVDFSASLAHLYLNWARIPIKVGPQPEEAARLCTQAITLAEKVLRKEPRHHIARDACGSAYGNRGLAYADLHREADAVKDWERAIELSDGIKRRQLQALLGWTLLHFCEYSRAAATARAIADGPNVEPVYLYEAAKMTAIAGRSAQLAVPVFGTSLVGVMGSPSGQSAWLGTSELFIGRFMCADLAAQQQTSQVEQYVSQVLEFLRRMHEAGHFDDPELRQAFPMENAFQWLHPRDDFQKVLREIEGKK